MSSRPIASALDVRTQAFPTLSANQINRVRALGTVRRVEKGEILFEPGETTIPFFVLLSGAMEIVQPSLSGERTVATHGPGGFTGEMTMISGRRSLVRGRVTEPGDFLELSEIFMRAFILRRLQLVDRGLGNIVLMGSRHSAKTLELREFLTRNEHPYTYVDLDADRSSQELLDRFHVEPGEIPVIVCSGGVVLRNPTIQKLADCLGLNISVDESQIRDLIIVGAGPAGLAAAVYAASEGLDVLTIEAGSPGGPARSSSKIENYLGFPTGLSGQELARRAIAQTEKFGAKMMVAHGVVQLDCAKRPYKVVLDNGNRLAARAVVIATGAEYKNPPIANLERFTGQGVYYG